MGELTGILLFVLVLMVVILIHEAAHFFTAKAFRIRVEEFFLGFGPRVWSTRRGETEYGVKAFPLGGYVRIAGMNPFEEPSPEDMPRTFGARPAWQRALVIAAGPATHFLVALVFFALALGVLGVPTEHAALISSVERTLDGKPSPAAVAGLRAGDEVVAVGPLELPSDEALVAYTRAHVGEAVVLRIARGEEELSVTVVPVLSEVEGKMVGRIGVGLASGRVLARERYGPIRALGEGAQLVGETTVNTVASLGRVFGPEGIGRIGSLLFGEAQREPDDVTSIVGGGRIAGQAAAAGYWEVLLFLFAGFNVFVGVLNLLPIPPFDGGHLAVIGIEKLTGRKVDARRLVPITAVVAAFLILFMVSLVYLDIVKPVPNLFR